MKKAYILGIICLLFFLLFNLNRNQAGFSIASPIENSILSKKYPSGEIGQAGYVAKPTLVGHPPAGGPTGGEDLDISANAYLVLDYATLSPLLNKNAEQKLYIGSLTKLMTAIIALENSKLDDTVAVKFNTKNIPSSTMGLFEGEEISLENLLYGVLISSSNDAAEAVALYVGGGDPNRFVQMMNSKAKEIGMANTHFANAMGLDNLDNYSTAEDLAYLSAYALQNPFIEEAVKIKEKRVQSADGAVTHYLLNTNRLLFEPDLNIFGLKTGSTPWAGECLIAVAQNKNGNEIIAVLLSSSSRFSDAKKLIEWTWENVGWE